MNEHEKYIRSHYGRLQPLAASEPYAIVPSKHSEVRPVAVRAGGEGLVVPPLSPEAAALLSEWARGRAPAETPPPPPLEESTYYRLRRPHRGGG